MTIHVDPDGTLHETYTGVIELTSSSAFKELPGEISYDAGDKFLNFPRNGVAFFCRYCGNIWGRVKTRDSKGVEAPYDVSIVACSSHSDPWEIPGSILHKHIGELLYKLPAAVVQRELEVHLNYFEKGK